MKTNNFFACVEEVTTNEMESIKGGGKIIIVTDDGTIIIIDVKQ